MGDDPHSNGVFQHHSTVDWNGMAGVCMFGMVGMHGGVWFRVTGDAACVPPFVVVRSCVCHFSPACVIYMHAVADG